MAVHLDSVFPDKVLLAEQQAIPSYRLDLLPICRAAHHTHQVDLR